MSFPRDPQPAMPVGRLRVGRRDVSSRLWLAAFTLFVCGSIVAVFAFDRFHARDVAAEHARDSAQNLAQSLSDEASGALDAVGAAQVEMSDRIETGGIGPAARLRLRDAMAGLVAALPQLHAFNYLDEHGRFIVGHLSATSGWLPPVADRPYFRYHRSHALTTVHISGPALSRLDNSSVIFVTRRVDRPDGGFAGVLVAQLSLDYFERSYSGVDVGRQGSIKLLGDDGRLLIRKPRKYTGRLIREDPVFADPYRYLQAGSFLRTTALDGIWRLVAFQRLGKYPLVVEVGLAQSEYLSDWRNDTIHGSIALAVVLLMIGGLATVLGAQIARRERAEADLSRLALIDSLTGLANRRQFDAVFEREWRRASRDRTPLGLLMIDVDNFKCYNDRYGHQRGDDVLRSIANTIGTHVRRPSDVAARYGGEEFAVVLPLTDTQSALVVAERIRAAVTALRIPHADTSNAVAGVSIGVASIIPPLFAHKSMLVEAADGALYDAKDGGRNRVCTRLAYASQRAAPDRAESHVAGEDEAKETAAKPAG